MGDYKKTLLDSSIAPYVTARVSEESEHVVNLREDACGETSERDSVQAFTEPFREISFGDKNMGDENNRPQKIIGRKK